MHDCDAYIVLFTSILAQTSHLNTLVEIVQDVAGNKAAVLATATQLNAALADERVAMLEERNALVVATLILKAELGRHTNSITQSHLIFSLFSRQ